MCGEPERKAFAYAFYATDDTYAIAVIVLARLLRQLGVGPGIGFVVVHLPLAPPILAAMAQMGMTTIAVPRPPQTRHWYFRDCLVKLRILLLTQYERVIYLDADSLPLKSFDDLFSLPFDGAIAAPPALWVRRPWFTTLMMMIKPSESLWQRAERHFPALQETGFYDGNIINEEFGPEIFPLPDTTIAPNSYWADAQKETPLGMPDRLPKEIRLVHFYDLGKPWRHHPDRVPGLRPKAHPAFAEQRRAWWQERERLIAESPPALRRVLIRRKALDRTALPKLYKRSRYRLERVLGAL
ncbi:MAG: hypothetical protein AAF495_09305 [Pseudomonadota bacterium]